MVRGRRVVYVGCILFSFFLLFPSFTSAASFSMSAKVPLSPIWQKAIENQTTYDLDIKTFRNIARLSLQVKGVNNILLADEHIQILLFKNNQLVDIQEKQTLKTGEVQFTLIYTHDYSYRIIILDTEYEYPFVIKTISFTP